MNLLFIPFDHQLKIVHPLSCLFREVFLIFLDIFKSLVCQILGLCSERLSLILGPLNRFGDTDRDVFLWQKVLDLVEQFCVEVFLLADETVRLLPQFVKLFLQMLG